MLYQTTHEKKCLFLDIRHECYSLKNTGTGAAISRMQSERTLPSELIPLRSISITSEMLRGMFPLTKRFKNIIKGTLATLTQQLMASREDEAVICQIINQLENTGIDPITSRMLREHSTI